MTPAMMGQFPAAALIYRKGLVAEGDLMVDLNLRPDDLFELRGTPLPQDASFDELRLKDVPKGLTVAPGQVIDPLVHFTGRTSVTFPTAPAGGPEGPAPVRRPHEEGRRKLERSAPPRLRQGGPGGQRPRRPGPQRRASARRGRSTWPTSPSTPGWNSGTSSPWHSTAKPSPSRSGSSFR